MDRLITLISYSFPYVYQLRLHHFDKSQSIIQFSICQQSCIAGDFRSMKFDLQFSVKIEPKSILASFTHWVLQIRTVKTGLNSIHKLYTIKIQFVCHCLLGKCGLSKFHRFSVFADQFLNINLLMNNDLSADEFLYCTTKTIIKFLSIPKPFNFLELTIYLY